MGDRGRTPASELALATQNVTSLPERPRAPEDLTAEQQEIWRETVEAMPPNWFRPETHQSLSHYCVHVAEGRYIAGLIEEMKGNPDLEVEKYDRLCKMQERESRAAELKARSLRLTLQSTYDKSKKKGSPGKKPWEK